MLLVGKCCKSRAEAWSRLEGALADGAALDVFRRMVKAQGGDVRVVDDTSRLPRSKHRLVVNAPRSGFVHAVDAYALGLLAIELGAGRVRADQAIDPSAGFELLQRVGEPVTRGAPLIVIHAKSAALCRAVHARVAEAFEIRARAPNRAQKLVLARIR